MHRRPRLTATLRTLGVALLALPLLAACSRAVDVTPAPSAADPACTALAGRLPAKVEGQARRDTSPRSRSTAAWGDPAIILRCGVTPPGPTDTGCTAVNDVDWVGRQLSDGWTWTTYGRDPAVQVLVPHAYAPEVNPLTDLAAAVGAIPQGPHRCT